jgi:hypothetical protein
MERDSKREEEERSKKNGKGESVEITNKFFSFIFFA